jgi:NADH-quinone oxidoreductase subunit I
VFGKGLIQGMKITLGWFFRPKVTVQYPEQRCPLPDRFHGKPRFDYDKCIACNLCVAACPNQVIQLEAEKVGRKKLLTRYDFDLQYCLFCGFCAEACPKEAIQFTKDFEMTQYDRSQIKIRFVTPAQVEKRRNEINQETNATGE